MNHRGPLGDRHSFVAHKGNALEPEDLHQNIQYKKGVRRKRKSLLSGEMKLEENADVIALLVVTDMSNLC